MTTTAFCNPTGLWEAWAILWPLEPLAVGLGLLIRGVAIRSSGAKLAGLILTGIAGAGFFIASFISVFNGTLLRFAVPGDAGADRYHPGAGALA